MSETLRYTTEQELAILPEYSRKIAESNEAAYIRCQATEHGYRRQSSIAKAAGLAVAIASGINHYTIGLDVPSPLEGLSFGALMVTMIERNSRANTYFRLAEDHAWSVVQAFNYADRRAPEWARRASDANWYR